MNLPASTRPNLRLRLRQVLGWLIVALVLGLVFLAYAHPQLMVDLADQLWSCF